MRQLLIGRNVRARPGAARLPPATSSSGPPRTISASTSEMSAPRRYDVAGFLLAGGNRLLSASIDASQAGSVMGQRLPTRSTGPTRFIGVPSRTASRVTGATATRRRASRCNWRGNQPIGNTPWRSLYRRWRQEPDHQQGASLTRWIASFCGLLSFRKHELIPRTAISTRPHSNAQSGTTCFSPL
jgi:hypothetical protein